MTGALTVAVVGHTNTGKTSLLRTLTRDTSFGEVSPRPAVTREVASASIMLDAQQAIILYDTPGLEDSINLYRHLQQCKSDREIDNVDVINAYLDSPEAQSRFAQEAKAIRQVLDSHVALYVIDARDRVLGKHRDELAILNMCARPIVPVLNFVAKSDARTDEWREQLSRLGLHAVATFDTVLVTEDSEQHLYEKMRSLLDRHRPLLDALIEDRKQQRQQLIASSARLIAEMLVDAASFRLSAPTGDEQRMKRAVEQLKDALRNREQQCVEQLLELHRFHSDDCDPSELPIEQGRWGLDLFNPDALKQFGVRTGSAAAAGAVAGAAIDLAVGGVSLGAAAATGAAIGAALSAGRSHGRRLFDRMRGRTELRCNQQTLLLLATRQIMLVRALLTRGHASQNKLHLKEQAKEQDARRSGLALPVPLRRASAHPEWSAIRASGSESAGVESDRLVSDDSARAEAVEALAEQLIAELSAAPGAPISLR